MCIAPNPPAAGGQNAPVYLRLNYAAAAKGAALASIVLGERMYPYRAAGIALILTANRIASQRGRSGVRMPAGVERRRAQRSAKGAADHG